MTRKMIKRSYFSSDTKRMKNEQKAKVDAFICDILRICKKHKLFIVGFDDIHHEAYIDTYEKIHASWFKKVYVWIAPISTKKNKEMTC